MNLSSFAGSKQANEIIDLGKIELLRDFWGVPHIFAETDRGAFYGLGYACAQDRAFQMYFGLRIIQGRSAELLGDIPLKNRHDRTTVWSDKKVRTEGFYRAAQRLISTLDPETVSFLQAYSDGVNDSLQKNRDRRIDLFKKYDLNPEPWTPADCIATWWHLGKFFAAEDLNEGMIYHRLKDGESPRQEARGERGDRALIERAARAQKAAPDDTAAVIGRDDVSDAWIQTLNRFVQEHNLNKKDAPAVDGPKFSHAWVVGKEKTTTKSSVLCSDPQTPVRNPSLFYEFHISGKTFNARGIGVPGSPALLIGWTPNVAWGVTALGADQADLFLLKTDEQHPNQYFFDGEWRDMTVWQETLKVKGAKPITMTLRESHLGPVVTSIANGLKPGEEVAQKRIPICDKGCETIQGVIAMMRAGNAMEFSKAIYGWRFPSLNIVYGDRDGNIGYCALAAVPVRSQFALEGGNAAHEGFDSKYDWQGILPYEMLPQVMNPKNGFLFSGNHRPIQSFYPIPIGISTGSLGDTDRSWRLRQRLENKEIFAPEEIQDIHYDNVNAARRGIVAVGYHLRDRLKVDISEDALKSLKYLEEWFSKGSHSENSIAGTELVLCIPLMFRIITTELAASYGGGASGLCKFLKEIETRIDKKTDAPMNDLERQFIDQTLAQAWQSAETQFGSEPKDWPKRAREKLLQSKLGYMESLDGFGSLDPGKDITIPELSCTDGGTIFSQAAQSFSQWVPMDDVDSAQSLLPIGNSECPESPYRTCTYEAWRKGELHPAPITRKAIESICSERETLNP